MPLEFLIEYTVKDGAVEQATAAKKRFFAALSNLDPERIRYRALSKPDGKSFVHLGWFADEGALEQFQALPEFAAFGPELRAACSEGPDASPIIEEMSSHSVRAL